MPPLRTSSMILKAISKIMNVAYGIEKYALK